MDKKKIMKQQALLRKQLEVLAMKEAGIEEGHKVHKEFGDKE